MGINATSLFRTYRASYPFRVFIVNPETSGINFTARRPSNGPRWREVCLYINGPTIAGVEFGGPGVGNSGPLLEEDNYFAARQVRKGRPC